MPPPKQQAEAASAHLWAKSDGSGLFDHVKDVCSQANQFYEAYRPEWPLNDSACMKRILAYSALLHDLGKAHPGFQKRLRGEGEPFGNRHEILSLAYLEWLRIPEGERLWVEAAIATHHKGWAELRDRYRDAESEHTDLGRLVRGLTETDELAIHSFLAQSAQHLEAAGWAGIEAYESLPYQRLYHARVILAAMERVGRLAKKLGGKGRRGPGERMVRDWDMVRAAIHARGWMLASDHLASFGCEPIRRVLESRAEVDRRFPGFVWKHHQVAAGEHSGSALLIAPTGSGKTEAALLWAGRQAEAGSNGRLVFLLPYQASLNAMQQRLIARVAPEDAGSPSEWNRTVGLLHGRAGRRLYEEFLAQDYAAGHAAREAKRQNELARLFAAPVALSTVFGVIRLLFATRGAERLIVPFHGARIVLDEVHAYAPEITAMTLAALEFLQQRFEARVLFMSATVPGHLERVLTERMDAARVPKEPPWSKARHRLALLPFDSGSTEGLDAVLEASKRGSVLVVVNQVIRAVRLFERLRQRACCELLHSRFHHADRGRIERALDPRPGTILVATQAVEVSLDLDFDSCFTELAPLESIAQRFGRCNRRGAQTGLAPVRVFERFPDGRYANEPYKAEHLQTVLQVLRDFCSGQQRELGDGDLSAMLDASYPVELKAALSREIAEKAERLRQLFLDEWQPLGIRDSAESKELEKAWAALFDGEEVLPESLVSVAETEETTYGLGRWMVPVSSTQMRRFRSDIFVHERLGCPVIRRPYGEAGLDLRG